MTDAHKIINRISRFLDKFSLKTNSLTDKDLIDFIESEWEKAGDEKYDIHQGDIIMGRMINEYIRGKDFENMMRWLEMSNLHKSSQKHPDYILNYYNGECCLKCGNEEKALEYFNLCYRENPDYIYSRAPFCYEFFNKNTEYPRELPVQEDEYESQKVDLQLACWQKFFKESNAVSCIVLNEDNEEITELADRHEEYFSYIEKNQKEILRNILKELLEIYPVLQKRYDYSEEDKPDFMPDLDSIEGFSELLSIYTIYIIEKERGQPHIGFLFGFSWDSEHGLGVMTYKKQVEDIGGAETAFII